MASDCCSVPSARVARFHSGWLFLNVTLMHTDKSRISHASKARASDNSVWHAASRAPVLGFTSACVFVDNIVYTRMYLHIPLPHKLGCTCDVTIPPFTVTPTFVEKIHPRVVCAVAVQRSFLSFSDCAARARVITAWVNCVFYLIFAYFICDTDDCWPLRSS